jgi:hypothetical protein
MIVFERMSTEDLYKKYCEKCPNPYPKIEFCRRFLKENPEYTVKVTKVNGKSVRVFVRTKTVEHNVSDFL